MSQATKILKKIASAEEYKALVTAIEKTDGESALTSYQQISQLLEETEKEVRDRIQSLTRKNKDDDYQKFRATFALRVATNLPQWHWLNSELKKQKIMEGAVFGRGTKGDPLVRTAEGRVVVIRGATLKEGDKVRFKVIVEGEKLDFGKVLELTPDLFYYILTRDTRERIENCFAAIRERLSKNFGGTDENSPGELTQLLRELENIRELTAKLGAEERERIMARVMAYRKSLLKASVTYLAFQFLSQQEEKELKESCPGDEQQLSIALSALGLFRYQTHKEIKAELFSGKKLKGYDEIVNNLENNLESMEAALKLLEFKTRVKEAYPLAQRYLQKMDRFFQGLDEKATQVALSLAGGNKLCSTEDIYAAVRDAFSSESLRSELRKAFRSSEEFFTLRGALLELRAKLGGAESTGAEAALRPYLQRVIALTFGERH